MKIAGGWRAGDAAGTRTQGSAMRENDAEVGVERHSVLVDGSSQTGFLLPFFFNMFATTQ